MDKIVPEECLKYESVEEYCVVVQLSTKQVMNHLKYLADSKQRQDALAAYKRFQKKQKYSPADLVKLAKLVKKFGLDDMHVLSKHMDRSYNSLKGFVHRTNQRNPILLDAHKRFKDKATANANLQTVAHTADKQLARLLKDEENKRTYLRDIVASENKLMHAIGTPPKARRPQAEPLNDSLFEDDSDESGCSEASYSSCEGSPISPIHPPSKESTPNFLLPFANSRTNGTPTTPMFSKKH